MGAVKEQRGPGLDPSPLMIVSLLFANEVVLLASSTCDLQLLLEQFTAKFKAAGMRISTSRSETMVLSWKWVKCSLHVGTKVLPQVEEFKYLGVLFTSEGRMEWDINRWISAASAVMHNLYRFAVVKRV